MEYGEIIPATYPIDVQSLGWRFGSGSIGAVSSPKVPRNLELPYHGTLHALQLSVTMYFSYEKSWIVSILFLYG